MCNIGFEIARLNCKQSLKVPVLLDISNIVIGCNMEKEGMKLQKNRFIRKKTLDFATHMRAKFKFLWRRY